MIADHRDLSAYDYDLPPDRIAQYPVTPRDASRLLVVSREKGAFYDRVFTDLPELLCPDDLIVLNNTRVMPARLYCNAGEVLLIRRIDADYWDTMVYPGKKFKAGKEIVFSENVRATVIAESHVGRILKFSEDAEDLMKSHGVVPLPPYIGRDPDASDTKRYQTVYATASGSVAAPTAGLHFTRRTFQALRERLIHTTRITLHVGPGTFRPVKSSDITRHRFDPEYYRCSRLSWRKISRAKRVVAVGTTTTRALETMAMTQETEGVTDLFIYPGFTFHCVQALLTNFHLPRSSLLMLVSAFGGYDLIREAYHHAIENDYRFYSYGDAMLIL